MFDQWQQILVQPYFDILTELSIVVQQFRCQHLQIQCLYDIIKHGVKLVSTITDRTIVNLKWFLQIQSLSSKLMEVLYMILLFEFHQPKNQETVR